MNFIADLEYRLLKWFWPGAPPEYPAGVAAGAAKLERLLGPEFLRLLPDKAVIDFGCGEGLESVVMAQLGAMVTGLDIREEILQVARANAAQAGVSERCEFLTATREPAQTILSLDAFEHFEDPAGILRIMDSLLVPEGEVVISFGPVWRHPLGGHLFSVFPWAHLLFREDALLRWRRDFKSDGATRFHEVAGGLNQMTIRRFVRLVEDSPFRFVAFETVPIRRLRPFHNAFTREFTTALVRCRLRKKAGAGQ